MKKKKGVSRSLLTRYLFVMTETASAPERTLRRLYPGRSLEVRRTIRLYNDSQRMLQDCFNWPFESLDALESSFNVQEYLQQLIRLDCSDVQRLIELPENVDDEVWQYEHLRYALTKHQTLQVLNGFSQASVFGTQFISCCVRI